MKPVRPVAALVAFAVVTFISAAIMQFVRNSDRALPQHSWWEVLLVLGLGAALVTAGWRVRDQVRARTRAKQEADAALRAGQGEDDVRAAAAGVMRGHDGPSPETARRVVVFSQAGAVGGGVLAGWYLGQAVIHLMRLNIASSRSAAMLLGVLTLAAVVLSAVGFVVQAWCTIPDDEK